MIIFLYFFWHQGDGFVTVLVTGKELGSPGKEIFQNYSWSKVPGVTCSDSEKIPQVNNLQCTSNQHVILSH